MVKKSGINISGDLEKIVKKKANDLLQRGVKSTCPSCKNQIVISPGKNTCSFCGAEINFNGSV
ncbi:hypothetical protein A5819_003444 [Enterococcus sp. 7E2_DIV0204]|uniref:hypothetical protein n=1 Tax=unclassified Enterococcus TaxID=2608891 RepID=UPI000A338A71|nr:MULTISPECIES: hypothetical protein [unclassified Enterococcus]OTN86594.1 hypothetical protein A5819_003444 [Enterococcus sp. 7E2_DIV0204]OTP47617.1 hypothetical protein A5884_003372 [Enterococcus sp. 7D2_DIV0200]